MRKRNTHILKRCSKARKFGLRRGRNINLEHRFANESTCDHPKLALARRLPMLAYSRENFEHGALVSYAADQIEMCRRSAAYVDNILKGAKPADLPVEQPTKLELLIDHKTAKALGLTIPQSILLRANELIE